MKQCCGSFVQASLVIFNSIWGLLSLLIAVLALQLLQGHDQDLNKGDDLELLPSSQLTAVFTILVGSVGFILAVLGCVGAAKEKANLMNIYAILLTLIAVCELGVGITAVLHRQDLEPIIQATMQDNMDKYGQGGLSGEGAERFWNSLQKKWSCCGLNGYTDWTKKLLTIPDSCCQAYSLDCQTSFPFPTNIYTEGCFQKYSSIVTLLLASIGVMAIVSGVLKIAGAVCGCLMAGEILRERARDLSRANMMKLENEKDEEVN